MTSQLVLSPFERALYEFKDRVRKEKLGNGVQAATLDELTKELDVLQTQQHARRTLRNMGRIKGFLEATEQLGKVIEVFCQASEVVTFIWGPLKFLLQLVGAHTEAVSGLIGVYEGLGETLSLIQQSWYLHQRDAHLETCLVGVYKDILEFHRRAMEYFKKPAWKRFFDATWKTYKSKFSDLTESMKEHREVIVQNTALAQFRQNRQDKEERQVEMHQESSEKRFRELCTWLKSADVESDHQKLREAQITGSGRWLFANPQFKKWFDPNSPYTPFLLWMNGKPGAGKSVLASMVIEGARAITATQNAKPKVLYFYCKMDDDERDNFVSIGRSLLLQILDRDSIMVHHFYKVYHDSKDIALLKNKRDIEELLEAALLDCPNTYIILDGIDECRLDERQDIVSWFRKFVTEKLTQNNHDQVRVLFVSQDDMRSSRDFSEISNRIKIKVDDNRGDVRLFGESQAERIQQRHQLLPNEMKDTIATRVADGSDGIFLLARLICDNLYNQATLMEVYHELEPNVFPREINDAYDRIMKRILKHAKSQRLQDYCLMIFGWLVCAKRPLKWHEIQCIQAIDPNEDELGLEKRRFVDDAKTFCGSLVEDHHDGTIRFVHLTARWFLIEKEYVVLAEEEVKFASKCIDYLNRPALCKSFDSIDDYILHGHYAFMDYAISNWVWHLEGAAKRIDGEETTHSMADIAEYLDLFLDQHWANPTKPALVADRHKVKLKAYESFQFYERLVIAFGWARKTVKSHTTIVASEVALDLVNVLTQVRGRIEEVLEHANPERKDQMTRMYGTDLFKCPRPSCYHFSHGFDKRGLREEHFAKHERPYRCSSPGCPYAATGFSKAKDLQKHMEHTHDSLGENGSNIFPTKGEKKKKPAQQAVTTSTNNTGTNTRTNGDQLQIQSADTDGTQVIDDPSIDDGESNTGVTSSDTTADLTQRSPSPATPEPMPPPERPLSVQATLSYGPKTWECTTCAKIFKKKFNYQSHMRTHSSEKPYRCQYCSRGFARESDRKRHEKIHEDAGYRCEGCGKEFKRGDTLQSHLKSQTGVKCWQSMLTSERT